MRKINVEVSTKILTHDTNTTIRFISETIATTQGIDDFKGELGESCIRYVNDLTYIYVGMGNDDIDGNNIEKFIKGVVSAIKLVENVERSEVAILCPNDRYLVEMISLHSLLTLYKWDKYKSKKNDEYNGLEKLIFLSEGEDSKEIVENNLLIAESVFYARDLQNDNADVVTPKYLAQSSKNIGTIKDNLRVTILDKSDIMVHGLYLLNAVGKDSPTPPRLIIMEYNGDPSSPTKTGIVGKGVTYDSGGLSLKPSDSMLNMRMDMSGASAVLGFMKYVVETQPKKNFVAIIPAAHNSIGSNAFMVGDVIKAYDGTTVENINSDGEGRLIIADAISYLVKKYKPTEIIDLATLTGNVISALGDTIAGIFSNNDRMVSRMCDAGNVVSEYLWRLPIRNEHRDSMKSDIADIRNISKNMKCGSITAAAFIEHFVNDINWCHIDIAGTAMNDKVGGTGYGVQLLIQTLL